MSLLISTLDAALPDRVREWSFTTDNVSSICITTSEGLNIVEQFMVRRALQQIIKQPNLYVSFGVMSRVKGTVS
jgi:hypothetical protein